MFFLSLRNLFILRWWLEDFLPLILHRNVSEHFCMRGLFPQRCNSYILSIRPIALFPQVTSPPPFRFFLQSAGAAVFLFRFRSFPFVSSVAAPSFFEYGVCGPSQPPPLLDRKVPIPRTYPLWRLCGRHASHAETFVPPHFECPRYFNPPRPRISLFLWSMLFQSFFAVIN